MEVICVEQGGMQERREVAQDGGLWHGSSPSPVTAANSQSPQAGLLSVLPPNPAWRIFGREDLWQCKHTHQFNILNWDGADVL